MYRKYASGKIDNSATNCDVEESPLRYTRSRRDRVREAKSQLPRCQRDKVSAATGNSRRRGKSPCAVERIFRPPNSRYVREGFEDTIKSYVIHDSD